MAKKKAAVLEGNAETAGLLAKALEDAGFEVCTVTGDGAEGLAAIEREAPDAAVVSMVLRQTDGLGVLEGMREKGLRTKAVVLGSFAEEELIGRVMEAGAKYYLMKPVSVQVVAERVKESVTEGQARQVGGAGTRTARGDVGGEDQRDLHRDRDPAAHQGIRLPAGRDPAGGGGPDDHQQRDEAAVSCDRGEIRDEREQGRACDPARDRSGVEPAADGGDQRGVRGAGLHRERKADQQRIHRARRGQAASGRPVGQPLTAQRSENLLERKGRAEVYFCTKSMVYSF